MSEIVVCKYFIQCKNIDQVPTFGTMLIQQKQRTGFVYLSSRNVFPLVLTDVEVFPLSSTVFK